MRPDSFWDFGTINHLLTYLLRYYCYIYNKNHCNYNKYLSKMHSRPASAKQCFAGSGLTLWLKFGASPKCSPTVSSQKMQQGAQSKLPTEAESQTSVPPPLYSYFGHNLYSKFYGSHKFTYAAIHVIHNTHSCYFQNKPGAKFSKLS